MKRTLSDRILTLFFLGFCEGDFAALAEWDELCHVGVESGESCVGCHLSLFRSVLPRDAVEGERGISGGV